MRATRSDSLILDECRLPESAAVYRSDDTRPFRHDYLNWFWGSYTPVYLGIAQAAFEELCRVMHAPTRRVRSAAGLSPRRAPPCCRDERRSRSGVADHLPLG